MAMAEPLNPSSRSGTEADPERPQPQRADQLRPTGFSRLGPERPRAPGPLSEAEWPSPDPAASSTAVRHARAAAPAVDLSRYLDASATSPPAPEVLAAMADQAAAAWANPSSLHGPGLVAAELLERSRIRLAGALGTEPGQIVFCSGGSEAIHLALLGSAALMQPGRLLVSAVEHPATLAAAGQDPLAQLRNELWQRLSPLEGLRLSGPVPDGSGQRLPHHLSLLVSSHDGRPLSGRAMVQALARRGWAVSSGSACSSASGAGAAAGASPILLAMGYSPLEARSGLRLSLGPWLQPQDLEPFAADLDTARRELQAALT